MKITQQCTGCMACYNKCPQNAIKIVYSEDGFYVPEIEEEKCTHCGLCAKICPQNNDIKSELETNNCYAAAADDIIREKSASGGVFALIAKKVLEDNGYVCGAAFCDKFRQVKHIVINNVNDLSLLQNSKYVQSNINTCLKDVEEILKQGKTVLFSGTPCQIAGLMAYLQKDYANLITTDIICHGIPSPLVWGKYVDEISNDKVLYDASFRDKKQGWHGCYNMEFKFKNKMLRQKGADNLYYRAFFEHLILNACCYNCKYTNLKRVSDITLGDFWGIEQYNQALDDNKGTSLVLINTPKGKEILQDIDFKFFEEVPLKFALEYNPRLHKPSEKNLDNTKFIKAIDKGSILTNIQSNLSPRYEGIIRNFWNIQNFGATLSAYAIQQYFFNHGKNYYLLKTSPSQNFVNDFAQKYLKTTHLVRTEKQYKELNKCTDNFILGTDQVLRGEFVMKNLNHCLFAYTEFKKKRIVFSGSFGYDNLDKLRFIDKKAYSTVIQRFDYISTRETSGVDICKKEFNIKAEYIIDPVFLVDKSLWNDMASDTGSKYQGKIVTYIFHSNDEILKVKEFLKTKYNKESIDLINGEIPPEEFLSAIKNADFVITNSFHGMCFSLIFNKKVLCVKDSELAPARFDSLIELFDIEKLFVNSWNEIYTKKDLFAEYDRDKIEDVINKERIKAENWFEKAVNSPKKFTLRNIFAELRFQAVNFIVLRYLISLYNNRKLLFLLKYSKKKIVFWGASCFLSNLLQKYNIKNKNILGIIDKNTQRHYKRMGDYTIYPVEQLKELKPDIVICSILNNHETVYPQIKAYLQQNYPSIELNPDIFS